MKAGLRRLAANAEDVPLHGARSSRELEQAAQATEPEHALMRRAGVAVARLALAVAPHAGRIWIACGPGNNGGDGLEAAVHLKAAGRRVDVTLLGDPARAPADAAAARTRAQGAGVPISAALPPEVDTLGLAIDALLGIGAGRPPAGALRDAIRCLSTVSAPVLSVDLPSGLHPDSGALLGDSAVRARHTLCLLTAKPGLHTAAGRDHAGELWLDPLGIALPWPADAALTGADRAHRALPRRLHAHHKGSFGDVVVVGGAMGMTGAAYLAARAALSLGAGRTFVSPLDGSAAMDLARPELMVRPSTWALRPETLAKATVVCGCGGGEAVAQALPSVLHHAGRLVLDADGLNAVAADSSLQGLLRARAQRGLHTVATPHPLEAARLLNRSSADVQADRFAAATELSRRTGCTVILKGSGSIVATEDHLPLVNPTGNALLASAGTGDVLAGALGALWAVNSDADPHDVAAAGAWWHGHAADRAAASGQAAPLTASRLIDAMAAAMR